MKVCTIDGCEKKFLARGWCAMHYWRWQNYGDATIAPPSRKPAPRLCGVGDCGKFAKTAGYCIAHYKRKIRHGDPLGGGKLRDRRPLTEKIRDGYSVEPSGCWEWLHRIDANGYGEVSSNERRYRAHRVSYQVATGSTDFGSLDHICRNRKCINPDHLREVSGAQNSQNQASVRDSKSGYRGVAWHEASKSWHVVVSRGGRQHSGGYFKDVHEAGMAAIELRNELFTHNEEDRWARG